MLVHHWNLHLLFSNRENQVYSERSCLKCMAYTVSASLSCHIRRQVIRLSAMYPINKHGVTCGYGTVPV